MLTPGTLLYFDPFVFKNGAAPKAKYFVVLAQMDDSLMIASLPTSKDHVPADAMVVRGCVDIPERGINAYVFEAGDKVTDTFAFPCRTFVYGEQVDDYSESALRPMVANMRILGQMNPLLFSDLLQCLKKAV